MNALKAETADAHAAVERRVDYDRLTGSCAAYLQTLEAFYGFYEPLEGVLAAVPSGRFGFEPESKTDRLAADLGALGSTDLGRVPRCRDLPKMASSARRVGALYVLEGASLGGRIISRGLAERLGITPETGGSFFHGSGERTALRWKEFGRAAEAAVTSEGEIAAAVAAARETFMALDSWLQVCGRHDDKEVR